MDLAHKIKRLRLTREMTLDDVAKYVGVSRSTVLRWETGYTENMRRDKIAKIAEALGTTPGYLMGWEPAPGNELSLSLKEEKLIESIRALPPAKQEIAYTMLELFEHIPASEQPTVMAMLRAVSDNRR